ncbi:MAG: phospholipase D-like domain-containing protein [Anaerolineae bacterium]
MRWRLWLGWLLGTLILAGCTPTTAVPATATPPPIAAASAPTVAPATAVPTVATPTGTKTGPTATPAPPITLYVQPGAENTAIVSAINQARQSIRLKIYLMTDDAIIRALKDAKARGVDVRVMVEPKPCCDETANNTALYNDLKAGGIDARYTNPTFTLTHEKTLVVDDALAFVMTSNLVRSAFTQNREYQVLTRVPADVQEVAAVFDADWNRTAPDLGHARLVWSPNNSRAEILKLIDGAQRRLDLEQLEIQDDEVVRHLEDAAKRGVQVRVLAATPIEGQADLNQPFLQRLEAAGAQVRRLDKPVLHAKVILADGEKALIGSINLTPQSIDFNREASIIVEDPRAIQKLASAMVDDWEAGRSGPVVPTAVAAPSVIPWNEAAKWINTNATVEGVITRTTNTGRVIYLDFSPRNKDMTVVIFPQDAAKFPQPPEKMYQGKKIQVTGKIQEYQGAPEIIVRSPDQIKIVE